MAPTTRSRLDRIRQAIHAPVAPWEHERMEHLGRLAFLLDGTQVSFSLYRHVEEGACTLRVAPARPLRGVDDHYQFPSAVNIWYIPGTYWTEGAGICKDAPHTITPALGLRALDTLMGIATLLVHTFFGGDHASYALTDGARLRHGRALYDSDDDINPMLSKLKLMQGSPYTTYGRYGFYNARGSPAVCAAYARKCVSTTLDHALRTVMRTAYDGDYDLLAWLLNAYGDDTINTTVRSLLEDKDMEALSTLESYIIPCAIKHQVTMHWDTWHAWHTAHGSPTLFVQ